MFDEYGNPIPGQSMALSREDITNNLTHIPRRQIGRLTKYLYHPATAALLLAFGAYQARETPGPAGMDVLGLSALATLYILSKYPLTFNSREREFNEVLSRYGFRPLNHSK